MAPMHEIEYKVFGDDMQFVEVELDPKEAAVAEAGGMMYMDDGIEMETIFGDGSQQQGGFMGALMGAGKRLLTGESLFMTVFHNESGQKRKVAFGAPYPGQIVPVHLSEIGGELIAFDNRCPHRGARIFTDTARVEADGYFDGGLITMTSGASAGQSMEVKSYAVGTITLQLPLPFGAGDGIASPQWAQHSAPRYLNYRKTTIYGGSNEVQRNIVARSQNFGLMPSMVASTLLVLTTAAMSSDSFAPAISRIEYRSPFSSSIRTSRIFSLMGFVISILLWLGVITT